jgi:hypothetical protein
VVNGNIRVFTILEVAAVISGALGRDSPKLDRYLWVGINDLHSFFLNDVVTLLFLVTTIF